MENNITVARCDATYVVKTPSRAYVINSAIVCFFNIFFAILGASLNAMVIWIFWRTKKLREKICYFMIMVLSCVDLSVTIIAQPIFLINSMTEITANAKCSYKILSQMVSVWLSGMSTMAFFTLNIERYLSIVHPVCHRNRVTKQKCFIFLIILWLICSVVAVGPMFSLPIDLMVALLALILCICTFYMYVAIFSVARKRVHALARDIVVNETQVISSVNTHQLQSAAQRNTVTTSQDFLLAKTCLLVVFTNLFCHLPNAIVLAVWREHVNTITTMVQIKIWTHSLVTINSTMNCLIFFWSNKTLGNEGWKALNQCCGRYAS